MKYCHRRRFIGSDIAGFYLALPDYVEQYVEETGAHNPRALNSWSMRRFGGPLTEAQRGLFEAALAKKFRRPKRRKPMSRKARAAIRKAAGIDAK